MSSVGLGRGRAGKGLAPTAEINVTSLVDVAFTLLVIFIITAPILQGGVEVDIPQADVRPLSAMEDLFIVSVTREGKVFLEDTELTVDEFEESFPQLARAGDIQQVYIRGDSAALYGPVLRVIAAVQHAGVPAALVGEPTPARKR